MPDYNAVLNPHYFGRGKVHFTAPLAPDGSVNQSAFGGRWGNNWPTIVSPTGEPVARPGRFVGNVAGMEILERVDRAKVSAWDGRSGLILQGVDGGLTLYGHGADNLAAALHGVRGEAGAEPITQHVATGQASIDAGGMLFTRRLVDLAWPVTVTPSWTNWTAGVQWEAEPFGIRLLQGFSAPPGSKITIGFTPESGAEMVDASQNLDVELGIVFAGINKADGAAVQVEIFRARPVLDGGLKPISEGASSVGLKFDVLPVYVDGLTHWYRVLRSTRPTEH